MPGLSDGEATAVPAPRQGPTAADGEDQLKCFLAGRVPISLIMDLAMPGGPHSRELLDDEGLPEVAWWERRPGA
jgi:hypothetical protein